MAALQAARAADPFAEHVEFMKALYQQYQRKDDADNIAFVENLVAEAQATCSKRESAVKDIIRDLSRKVAEAEALSAYPEPEGYHQKRISTLQRELQEVQAQVQRLNADTRDVGDQRTSAVERMRQATARSSQVDKQVADEEPVLRHQLSLFAHISKITWRLDRDDRIAGTISDSKNGDIRPIDMDANSLTQLERINKLWQLMG